MAGHASQARQRGRHALRSRSFADELVRDAGVEPGTRVLGLGAGGGVLTRALVDAGVRVRPIELDPASLAELRARFSSSPLVQVVEGDARLLPLRPSRSPWSRTCRLRPAPRSCGECSGTRACL